MFNKILIANRGEIACRVMRTARCMGIGTVAIYSDADAGAQHVREADEAVPVGPAPAAESYLVIDNILAAIEATGAEAVHPGYGFLSENEAFAEALEGAGVVFIGPGREAIRIMGDKIESKKLAAAAGVSTVPGHVGTVADTDQAVGIAREIGYPVMIKAAAGGGGKGMRIARDDDDAREGFERATSEARSSFGDDRVFIEKLIEKPRHIEIQVLADAHGGILHLGERECSIQRRHQKVIEEAPSPFLDASGRAAMGAQAVALAREVGYRSAGTVEFIVDAAGDFYFLEMNTRLQVEHPVTELVNRIDLVEQMIRIAAGEALGFSQHDIILDGWAIEARVYAEDPRRNFMPSAGRLTRYLLPNEAEGIRIDTGVAEGDEISLYYDPMIAKLCSYGSDREQAIERLRAALDACCIQGLNHNIPFLAAVLGHPRFEDGRLSTNFIDEEFPGGYTGQALGGRDRATVIAVTAAVHRTLRHREGSISGQVPGRAPKIGQDWVVGISGEKIAGRIGEKEDGLQVECEGSTRLLAGDWQPGAPVFHGTIDGRAVAVQIRPLPGASYRVAHRGAALDVWVRSPRAAELAALMPVKKAARASRQLRSPMPGLVVSIAVGEGHEFKAGETLAIIEAMKMENVLRAESDGVVAAVRVQPGDSLAVDQVILEFE